MGIIEGSGLVYEYRKYGEDGEVAAVTRAVDGGQREHTRTANRHR